MAKLIAGFQGWAMGVGEKERERECREVHPLINRPINTPSDSEFPVNFTVTTHDALVGTAVYIIHSTAIQTSRPISETMRKLPLVKAETAFKKRRNK